MAAFDHVAVLLSFVYALALTHLLSRIAGLLYARERVRFSGLLALWMVIAIILVFENWLSLWDAHALGTWTLYSIAWQFLFAITQYFVCAMAAPECPAEGVIDMEAMYARARVPLYGLMMATCVVALVGNADMMRVDATLFYQENLEVLLFFPFMILPLVKPARWAQWTGGLGTLLSQLIFVTLFQSSLH